MYGVAYTKNGSWYAEYQGREFKLNNDLPAHHRCYLAYGRDENRRVHFDKDGNVERIGPIRPVAVVSLRNFCRHGVDASKFFTKRGEQTVNLATMVRANLVLADGKYYSS